MVESKSHGELLIAIIFRLVVVASAVLTVANNGSTRWYVIENSYAAVRTAQLGYNCVTRER